MAEMQKYLDKAGLQVVWDAAKAKFIDDAELASALASYEKIEDLQRDYYNKSEITALINNLAQVYATKTELANGLATKVDKQITSASGKALIFNEADGGGAKFEHSDGTESFVGVNNGGQNGLMAQIYADKLVEGAWQGAKLDVYNDGIYYTVGNKSAAERKNVDNELVVKKDIKDLAGGMHFIGVGTYRTGVSLDVLIEEVYVAQGKVYADRKAGDLVVLKDSTNDREFVCDNNKTWIELGDQGLYATKAELAAEASSRESADSTEAALRETADNNLQANITAEASTRAAEDAKKSDLPPECPAWLNPTGETPYPWFMASLDVESTGLGPDAEGNLKANVGAYNFNFKQYYKWEKNLPMAASQAKAGLMVAADKTKLDNISTLTQAEIEEICK